MPLLSKIISYHLKSFGFCNFVRRLHCHDVGICSFVSKRHCQAVAAFSHLLRFKVLRVVRFCVEDALPLSRRDVLESSTFVSFAFNDESIGRRSTYLIAALLTRQTSSHLEGTVG